MYKGPIDNTSSFAEVMAWRRLSDKLLSEPMITQFTNTFLHIRRPYADGEKPFCKYNAYTDINQPLQEAVLVKYP